MVTLVRKEYAGGAVATTITASINNSVQDFDVANGASLPTGITYPFVLELDRGVAGKAEKVLVPVGGRSGNSITGATRGYDNTTPAAHDDDATVYHVLDATSLTHLWEHITDTTRDDHTQYLNTTRHDVTARHAFGAALGTPGAAADIATAASAGSGAVAARYDHAHKIGSGAINALTMFAAGINTGYVIPFRGTGFGTLADGTTLYFGTSTQGDGTTAGVARVYIPRAGTIKAAYGYLYRTIADGSSENSTLYIRLNNTTDTVLSSTIHTDGTHLAFSNTGLSIAVVAGDYIELKWVMPTWATDPSGNAIFTVQLYVE